MILAADFTDPIDPGALVAAGFSYVCRYLSVRGWPKNLTVPEAVGYHAAGLGIVLNFETSADFMLAGYRGGTTIAADARAQATELGAPRRAKIFYSADFAPTSAQVLMLEDFLHGAAAVDGAAEVGEYGGLKAVTAAGNDGFAEWQTAAWSGGVWDPRAVMRQTGRQLVIDGHVVDVNEVINPAGLGAWMPPATTTGEDDMPLAITNELRRGPAAVTTACPPPGNTGANWQGRRVWFSLGCDFADADIRVAAKHPDGRWEVFDSVKVSRTGLRVNPWNGPMPDGIQTISMRRNTGSEDVPVSYLIEVS